jgi:hypothetical protein
MVAGSLAVGACAKDSGLDWGFDENDSFAEVLDKLHATHPEQGDGLAGHAPMAAEALVTLGREDRVVNFVDREYPARAARVASKSSPLWRR